MLIEQPAYRPKVARRIALVALACALLLTAVPATATAATGPYTFDLGTRTDFVAQTNNVQCVGASVQMMLNMTRPGADRTAATQLKAQKLARNWSGRRRDGNERRGASVLGWSAALNIMKAGPYRIVGASTLQEAVQLAAVAMQRTGRPVGLLVWRGRHAWVMSGFVATADPLTKGGRVTGAIVEDPLYPNGSKTWGRSPSPGETLSLKELGRQFVPRRQSTMSRTAGKYVLVLPYEFDLRIHRVK